MNLADRTKKVVPVGDAPTKVIIPNTVDQSSPKAYQMERMKAALLNTSLRVSELTELGFTQQEADAIIDATAGGTWFKGKTELLNVLEQKAPILPPPTASASVADKPVKRRYLKFKKK